MPHYKAPDNSVHFIDSVVFEHILPVGSVQITDEEADALRPAPEVVEPVAVDPVEKLRAFLTANPDVQAIL